MVSIINSISELHKLMAISRPEHPSVSVVNSTEVVYTKSAVWEKFVLNFYCIAMKKHCTAKMRYGQQYYDFDEGIMTFTAPGQVLSLDFETEVISEGYMLFFHPDFIQGHPLAKQIKNHGFFSYAVNEGLHLSQAEEKIIENVLVGIQHEYKVIDMHTQNVVISQIELLLNYSTRFYERQFITRKKQSNDLLARFEDILYRHFDTEKLEGIETILVNDIAGRLNVSPNYLSDILKVHTGLSTQQHIQNKIIEKAKEILSLTNLSVAEIAYMLGFERPQSLNKLFKNKTNLSPLEYRKSFN
jgi:AraC-like DNA-binding protein